MQLSALTKHEKVALYRKLTWVSVGLLLLKFGALSTGTLRERCRVGWARIVLDLGRRGALQRYAQQVHVELFLRHGLHEGILLSARISLKVAVLFLLVLGHALYVRSSLFAQSSLALDRLILLADLVAHDNSRVRLRLLSVMRAMRARNRLLPR